MAQKMFRALSWLIEAVIILGSFIIVGMVTTEVVLRKFMGSSLIFTEEMARYLMVWIVFLGGAIAVRDQAHIRINFMVKRFSPKIQIFLAALAHLLTALFLVLLGIEGVRILPRQLYQTCICVDISMFCFYLAIPVGCALMLIYMIPKFKQVLAGDMVEKDQTAAEE